MQLYQLIFPNGKSYIGITTRTAQERFKEHCIPSRRLHPCQKAIHKYGKENVVLKVLACFDDYELLCLAEADAINKYKTATKEFGYNIKSGAEGRRGEGRNKERREKWLTENRDINLEKRRIWREQNKEKIAQINKEYREKNKESVKIAKKQWAESNKHKIDKKKKSESNKKYYESRKKSGNVTLS